MKRFLKIALSFLAGVLLGIFIHYVLYRVSLPVEPFIYASF